MAIQTIPVALKCSHCGKPMVLVGIVTTKADPNGQLLAEINQALALNGLCPECQNLYNHAVEQKEKGYGTDLRIKIIRIVDPTEAAAEG